MTMDRGARRAAKLIVTLLCLAWIGVTGWSQFAALPESEVLNHNSTAVKEKMRECEGSFSQRYDCKSAIVIESGRDTFANMVLRLSIVAVPPSLLAILLALALRRIPFPKPVRQQAKEDPDAWKRRATQHVTSVETLDHTQGGRL